MNGGDLRSIVRGGSLVALSACALMIAPVASAAAVAGPAALASAVLDTIASARADTVRADSVRADTLGGSEKKSVWKMDELKRVLGDETGTLAPGVKYRERKNGRVAMACALLVPGLGQIYNEKPLKAAIALGAETYYMSGVLMNRRYWEREKVVRDAFPVDSYQWLIHDRWVREYWERSVDWIWWSSAALLVVVIDAYVDAHLDDMRFRVEPRATDEGVGLSFVVPY